jgi:DNA-directed RNA polymerase specialized sigma24 family protein
MDLNLKKALEKGDIEEVVLRATSYGETLLRKYYWRGFRPSGSSKHIDCSPDSYSAGDFAIEALTRLLDGRRTYNPEKSLLENVKSVVESLISSAKKSSDRKPLSDYTDPPEESDEPSDPISMARSPQGEAKHDVIDAEMLEDQRRVFQLIRNSLDGDDGAQAYLDAMKEGFYKPDEIAEVTDLTVEEVYEIRRKIKKHVKEAFDVQNFGELKRKLVQG